jgi:ABC-type multidrug transport system fused ATPase/permease subunit
MTTGRRLIGYMSRQKGKILLGVLFTLVMALGEVATGVVFKGLLDTIPRVKGDAVVKVVFEMPTKKLFPKPGKTNGGGTGGGGRRRRSDPSSSDKSAFSLELTNRDSVFRGMTVICGVFLALFLLQWVGRYLRDVSFDCAIQRVLQRFKSDVCTKLFNLPPPFHDANHSGDLISRITYDVTMLNQVIDLLVEISRAAIYLLIFVPIMAMISWQCTTMAIVLCPVCYVLIRWASRHINRISKQTTDNVGDYTAFLDSRLNGIRTIQAFGTSEEEAGVFDQKVETNYQLNRKLILWTRMLKPASETIGYLGIAAIAVYLIHRLVYTDAASLGNVGLFLYVTRSAWKPVKKVADSIGRLQIALVSTKKIFRLMDVPISTHAHGATLDEPMTKLAAESLTFGYHKGEPILTDLSFQLNTGETLAITGPVGCGKSTLVSLLLGFHRPWSGRIVSNDDGAAMGRIAVSGAAFPLLGDSVADALSIATKGDPISADILKMLGRARISKTAPISSLSAGQTDFVRLLRARAAKPELIVLDEALNTMDASMRELAFDVINSVPMRMIVTREESVIASADCVLNLGSAISSR